MSKIISFMHISLDGFVCGPNGEMDWITINDEIFDHVEKRIGQTDTALYGRKTFQMMEAYWPTAADKPNATNHDRNHSKWYSNSQKIVLSKTINAKDFKNTIVINENISNQLKEIKKQTTNEILLFGSPNATNSLIQENIIDGYWLFINPIILGKGISLYSNHPKKTNLNLISSKQFNCGVVELKYEKQN